MIALIIETLNAEGSARAVAEAAEDIVLNGWEPTIGGSDGYSLYGLTNHPQTHTGDLSDWTTAPEDIRDNLIGMSRDLKNDDFRPGNSGYFVYIGEDLEDPLLEPDPEGTGDRLVRDRVTDLSDIGTLKVASQLDPASVLMFLSVHGNQLSHTDINRDTWLEAFDGTEFDVEGARSPTSHLGRHVFSNFWETKLAEEGLPLKFIQYLRGDKISAAQFESHSIDDYLRAHYEEIEPVYREHIYSLRV